MNHHEIPKRENKSCHNTLILLECKRCGQLTPRECDIGNIYWQKTNLSVVTDQESVFPQVASQAKKLTLGGTQAFHTIPEGNNFDLLTSRLE